MFSKNVFNCFSADVGPTGKDDVPSTGPGLLLGLETPVSPYRLLGVKGVWGNKVGRQACGCRSCLTSLSTGFWAKQEPAQKKQNQSLGLASPGPSRGRSPRRRGARREGLNPQGSVGAGAASPENPKEGDGPGLRRAPPRLHREECVWGGCAHWGLLSRQWWGMGSRGQLEAILEVTAIGHPSKGT